MVDEITKPEGQPEGTATPTIPTTFIGPNGELLDGWRDKYLPENIRSEKSLETIKNIGGLGDAFVNTKRMVGKDKIAIPGKNATEGEWNAYYDAAGRPKTPEDFKLEIPKDYEEYYDPEMIKEAKQVLHKAGLNQKQLDVAYGLYHKWLVQGKTYNDEMKVQKDDESEMLIDEIFGTTKEQSLHLVNRMIAENYPDESRRAKMLEAINKSSVKPYIMEFLSIVGRKFIDHKVPTDVPLPGQVNAEELKSQLNEYMKTDAYQNAGNPDHKFAVQKALRMREEINKMTVGK